MHPSGRLALLASAVLLVATTVGRPTLCLETDGMIRLESAVIADDCCADDARDHGAGQPTLADASCGCTDAEVALTARPIDPTTTTVAPPPQIAWHASATVASTTVASAVPALGPPPAPRSVVLRL